MRLSGPSTAPHSKAREHGAGTRIISDRGKETGFHRLLQRDFDDPDHGALQHSRAKPRKTSSSNQSLLDCVPKFDTNSSILRCRAATEMGT
jgi:hypothetical protein